MCNNCPFRGDEHAIALEEGRLDSIKESLLNGESFTCHKTIYEGGNNDVPKMCAGAYEFLKKENRPNQIMQIADRLGVETNS